MKISATVRNSSSRHEVIVSTGGKDQSLDVPTKPSGRGSSVNGGEFLMLAPATCYCNDLYREAARLGIIQFVAGGAFCLRTPSPAGHCPALKAALSCSHTSALRAAV